MVNICTSSKLHSRGVMISFIWMCVTAADFDFGPYATPLLTPALLPIGGVRHKILTRSMRFLHILATGNHSRAKNERKRGKIWRGGEKQIWEEDQEILQSLHFFGWDLARERSERGARGRSRCDMKQMMSAVTLTGIVDNDSLRMQAFPSCTFVVVKHNNKRLKVEDTQRNPQFLLLHAQRNPNTRINTRAQVDAIKNNLFS